MPLNIYKEEEKPEKRFVTIIQSNNTVETELETKLGVNSWKNLIVTINRLKWRSQLEYDPIVTAVDDSIDFLKISTAILCYLQTYL